MTVRLGVLEVGSNAIHLQVMDAHSGARPSPTTNFKVELRMTQYLNKSGSISVEGISLLHEAIASARAHAHKNLEIANLETSSIKLAPMSDKTRAELSGVSTGRAQQIVAGAIVARTEFDYC